MSSSKSSDEVVFYAEGTYFMADGAVVDIERDGTDRIRRGACWKVEGGRVLLWQYHDTYLNVNPKIQKAYEKYIVELILEA